MPKSDLSSEFSNPNRRQFLLSTDARTCGAPPDTPGTHRRPITPNWRWAALAVHIMTYTARN
jgi:hypothetical protein